MIVNDDLIDELYPKLRSDRELLKALNLENQQIIRVK